MTKTRRRHLNYDASHGKYGGHHQRSGKWTPEEEIMADKLIHGFQTGTLTDCAEGATLRSYLSKKLNCAPMRISKKFAGQCIGKHTYVTNTSNNPNQTMWTMHKSSKQAKSPRNICPTRCRQSPRSHVSADSSQYHYYDSDESESSEQDDDNDDDDDSRGNFTPPPSLAPARITRHVTLGSGASSAFTPIALHHPVTPTTPSALTPTVAPPAAPSPVSIKMDAVDLNEVYHSSYSSTPSCCVGGTICTAHHEEQQWREVLTTLFGGTDSSSPVRNIFQKDASSHFACDAGIGGGSIAQGVNVHTLTVSAGMCLSTPPPSPRPVTAPTPVRREGSSSSSSSSCSFSGGPSYAPLEFSRGHNPFYQLFK